MQQVHTWLLLLCCRAPLPAAHARALARNCLPPIPTTAGAASLVVALAPGLPTVMAGRLLYGVGIGFAMHAAPAYIAETSPARVRGLLISLKEAFIVGGILAG